MSDKLEDDVIAIEMDGEMRVRLADETPAWAYDVLQMRIEDSRSFELDEVSDGDRLGQARLDLDAECLDWFVPRGA